MQRHAFSFVHDGLKRSCYPVSNDFNYVLPRLARYNYAHDESVYAHLYVHRDGLLSLRNQLEPASNFNHRVSSIVNGGQVNISFEPNLSSCNQHIYPVPDFHVVVQVVSFPLETRVPLLM